MAVAVVVVVAVVATDQRLDRALVFFQDLTRVGQGHQVQRSTFVSVLVVSGWYPLVFVSSPDLSQPTCAWTVKQFPHWRLRWGQWMKLMWRQAVRLRVRRRPQPHPRPAPPHWLPILGRMDSEHRHWCYIWRRCGRRRRRRASVIGASCETAVLFRKGIRNASSARGSSEKGTFVGSRF